MRAAWYDRQGPAADVLTVGTLPDPRPAPGEVRVRVAVSGIHAGDLGKPSRSPAGRVPRDRYGTVRHGRPDPAVPYWSPAFKNVVVRFLSNDDFPEEANRRAAAELTAAVSAGDLRYPIAARHPLERIAEAHEAAVRSGGGRVVLDLPGGAS